MPDFRPAFFDDALSPGGEADFIGGLAFKLYNVVTSLIQQNFKSIAGVVILQPLEPPRLQKSRAKGHQEDREDDYDPRPKPHQIPCGLPIQKKQRICHK